jgi:biopolymer transport protein ExbD
MPENHESRPVINVTPMIDILLVLLIIFMAISPLKPSKFEAKVPSQPKHDDAGIDPTALIVTVNQDFSLTLNQESDLGTIAAPQKLAAKLSETFQKRLENQVYAAGMELRSDLTEQEKIQKTVFIKAPRNLPYGEIVKVIDTVKMAGARPIGLQIHGLENN